jgi:hypothetical protein
MHMFLKVKQLLKLVYRGKSIKSMNASLMYANSKVSDGPARLCILT